MNGKANIFLWFGLFKSIGFALKEVPPGCMDLANITKIPPTINYYKQSNFLFRAHIYHGRFEPCNGIEGNCKISISMHIGTKSTSSSIVAKTICPVWKETLIVDNIYFSGEPAYYKERPMNVVVQIWNHNSNSLKTLMGRIFCKPDIYLAHQQHHASSYLPALKWYKVALGNNTKGEILALFELFEKKDGLSGVDYAMKEHIPKYIQPKTVKYRLEVLFWGIRSSSRKNLIQVDHPKIIVDCGEAKLESQAFKYALNFQNFVEIPVFSTVEIPENIIFAPPLVIRLFNGKSHGKSQYIGSHTIKNVQDLKVHLVRSQDWMQIGSMTSEKHPKTVSFSFPPSYQKKEDCTDDKCDTSEMTPLIQNLSFKHQDILEANKPTFLHKIDKILTELTSRFVYRKQLVEYKPLKMDAKIIKHPDQNEKYFDWWTKYFARTDAISNLKSGRNIVDGKMKPIGPTLMKRSKQKLSKIEIYSCELEKLPIYNGFNDVLRTFNISKEGRARFFSADQKHVVGKFKGAIAIYENFEGNYVTKAGMDPKWGYFGSLSDEIVKLTVRVYVVRAYQLHNPRRMATLETYIEIETPSLTITDKDKLISRDYEPIFGKHFEFSVSLPQDYFVTIRVMNGRQLIGETTIDIENRYYSMHRGTCGLQELYHTSGYNAWRDIYKPTEILEWLCLTYNLEKPKYVDNSVEVAKRTFFMSQEKGGDRRECLALSVLRNWHTVPIVGCHLLKEHVETRSLFNYLEPGIEQGKLEMWVDMFPKHVGNLIPPPVDITPRAPDEFELRVILWSTSRTYSLMANDFYHHYCDLFVKAWIEGKEDLQQTDVHFRSWIGDGLFNWRFIYQFAYHREGFITNLKKEGKPETKAKIPPVLYLQLWDNSRIFPNEYLGSLSLDLHRIPEPSVKLFGGSISNPIKSKRTIDLFQKRHIRGWWEFKSPITKGSKRSEIVIALADLEMILLNLEDAEKNPAGYGRSGPLELPKPIRPQERCYYFFRPFHTMFSHVIRRNKSKFIKSIILCFLIVFVLLFLFAFPGQLARKVVFSKYIYFG